MVAQAKLGAKVPARVKALSVKELVNNWQGMQAFVVVCPIGLDAIESNRFREALVSKDIRMIVVKNSLARLALAELDLAPGAELLDAPSAICFGGESIVDLARELVDWSKKADALKLRGAFVEGQVFDADQTRVLAAGPNRSELMAKISSLITSPGGQLSSAIRSVGAGLAGAIKALAEKLAKDAPPAAESPAPEAEAAPEQKDEAQDAAPPAQADVAADTPDSKDAVGAKDASESKPAPNSKETTEETDSADAQGDAREATPDQPGPDQQ